MVQTKVNGQRLRFFTGQHYYVEVDEFGTPTVFARANRPVEYAHTVREANQRARSREKYLNDGAAGSRISRRIDLRPIYNNFLPIEKTRKHVTLKTMRTASKLVDRFEKRYGEGTRWQACLLASYIFDVGPDTIKRWITVYRKYERSEQPS